MIGDADPRFGLSRRQLRRQRDRAPESAKMPAFNTVAGEKINAVTAIWPIPGRIRA
jgi:hypothetical protein